MAQSKETPKMQERAIATRKKILDATLECLVEKGYAGTTTQEVCRRVGISRGTLLHHFATREELVIEAMEYILDKSVATFQETLANLSPDQLSLKEIARALWEEHWTSPTFYAYMELVMASRTDPILNKQVRAMDTRWNEKFADAFRSVLDREPDGPYWLFVLILNALSISTIHCDPAQVKQGLTDMLDMVDMADRFFIRFGQTPSTKLL